MEHFDKQKFEDLEKLCRIKCTPEEETSLLKDIEKILTFIEQLQAVSTDNVESCDFILKGLLSNVFRQDRFAEKDQMPTELFLSNAPEQIAGMVKVPTILKPR
ncbi:MAG: Asp-tRNA(Asn)/Glu-tRNA(Gln) amidotransferase subunit GatC [Parachlamydiales bacterium]|jgi:aspartyl-tRNA(Asn)/glutamyl-tRNA(Gln) amidotransferase subunit C